MGERLLCKQEVIGSIPFTSTILRRAAPRAKQDVLRSLQGEAGLVFACASVGGLDITTGRLLRLLGKIELGGWRLLALPPE